MESVILSSPLALFLYGAALFLNLFDHRYRMTKGVMTVISCGICVAATVYAIVIGATLWECATVLLVFLLINMGVKE